MARNGAGQGFWNVRDCARMPNRPPLKLGDKAPTLADDNDHLNLGWSMDVVEAIEAAAKAGGLRLIYLCGEIFWQFSTSLSSTAIAT
jgi:hypothetical protein